MAWQAGRHLDHRLNPGPPRHLQAPCLRTRASFAGCPGHRPPLRGHPAPGAQGTVGTARHAALLRAPLLPVAPRLRALPPGCRLQLCEWTVQVVRSSAVPLKSLQAWLKSGDAFRPVLDGPFYVDFKDASSLLAARPVPASPDPNLLAVLMRCGSTGSSSSASPSTLLTPQEGSVQRAPPAPPARALSAAPPAPSHAPRPAPVPPMFPRGESVQLALPAMQDRRARAVASPACQLPCLVLQHGGGPCRGPCRT